MKKQVAGAEDYNSQLENSVGYVCNLCGKNAGNEELQAVRTGQTVRQ